MTHTSDSSRKDYPNTYMVQDRSNQEELLRLDEQDWMLNSVMNGCLSEQTDPSQFRFVLDVACGTGGWALEAAQAYPTIERLWGVDVSQRMIEYACAKAEAAQLADRVSFKVGDALRMLELQTSTFDLVNHRLGMSFLRKWDWPNLLREYQRVCKPGGTIRITEGSLLVRSPSPALTRLFGLFQEAFYSAGHFFSNEPDGMTAHLAEQMEKYGIVDVQTRPYTYSFDHSNPHSLQAFVDDVRRLFRGLIPFLKKWTDFPQDYEVIYQQMVHETSNPEFQVTNMVMTAWGINRVDKSVSRP